MKILWACIFLTHYSRESVMATCHFEVDWEQYNSRLRNIQYCYKFI